jgi:hypothetical protein
VSGFRSETLYALKDPERYDDEEFGVGYAYALSGPDCDGCYVADCLIVDAQGRRHPGYDQCGVPIRIEDLLPVDVVAAMRDIARSHP